MTEQDVIAVKVSRGWRPSILMLREAKRKGLTPGLNNKATIAQDDRKPSPAFVGWWVHVFGYTAQAPFHGAPMVTPEGKPTNEFLDLWETSG